MSWCRRFGGPLRGAHGRHAKIDHDRFATGEQPVTVTIGGMRLVITVIGVNNGRSVTLRTSANGHSLRLLQPFSSVQVVLSDVFGSAPGGAVVVTQDEVGISVCVSVAARTTNLRSIAMSRSSDHSEQGRWRRARGQHRRAHIGPVVGTPPELSGDATAASRNVHRPLASPQFDRSDRGEGSRGMARKLHASPLLSTRELAVCLAIAGGSTTSQAARALFISPKTVEFHLHRIYRKLGVSNRAQLGGLVASAGLSASR
jgi:DNA-binding CsgD family transcriptional regulator